MKCMRISTFLLLLAAARGTAAAAAAGAPRAGGPTAASVAGEWESTACEIRTPVNGTTAEHDGWMTREITIGADGTWSGTFTVYDDARCTRMRASDGATSFNPFRITSKAFSVAPAPAAESGFALRFARNASFDTGFGYAESDVVMHLGGLLYLGARPLDGSGLTTEAKRPHSFAPGLRRKAQGRRSGVVWRELGTLAACRQTTDVSDKSGDFVVVRAEALAECQQKCVASAGCVAVEFGKNHAPPGECELWSTVPQSSTKLQGRTDLSCWVAGFRFEPQTALPTLADIAGEWQSACEKQAPIDAATGLSVGGKFWTREFEITAAGRWSGKFTTFSDPACKVADGAPFQIVDKALVLAGARPGMANTARANFDTGFGYHERDIVSLSGNLLMFGARPLDGSGLDADAKRPLSYAPPLTRKVHTATPTPATTSAPCVWGAYACPANSHIGPVACLRGFDDCVCNYGFVRDSAEGACVKPGAGAAFSCPAHSYFSGREWPGTSFEADCTCNYGYATRGVTCAKMPPAPPAAAAGCPRNSWIKSWPVRSIDDCTCDWGYVKQVGANGAPGTCTLPSQGDAGEDKTTYALSFPEGRDWGCDKLAMEADALVGDVKRATRATAVTISSSCATPAASQARSLRRRLAAEASASITVYGGAAHVTAIQSSLAARYGGATPSLAEERSAAPSPVRPGTAQTQDARAVPANDSTGASGASATTVGAVAAAAALVIAVVAAAIVRKRGAAQQQQPRPSSAKDGAEWNENPAAGAAAADLADDIANVL